MSEIGAYVRSLRWGVAVLVGSAAIAIYGAYGDPHPKQSQEDAVPFIVGVMAVITLVLFGALVAPGLRRLSSQLSRWAGVGTALGILGILAVPVSSWSGLPLALGAAGALLGTAGRDAAAKNGQKTGLSTAAMVLGLVAIVLSVVMVVLGNTVLSS